MSGLRVEEQPDRLVVTLDRPEKRNAIDTDLIAALHEVCAELEAHPRMLLLTGGTDGIFAGGADIAQLRERGRLDALAAINSAAFARIRALPMPTVAAIDGPALGGGAELAYACDLRVCSARAVFGQPEVRLGILAGAGATHRLPALVGEALAKELLFTGRRVDAAEALRIGLVNRVVTTPDELLPAAHGLIDEMAKGSALALRLTKLAVDAPTAAHPQLDLVSQAVLFTDEEKHRRMTEFLDRRRGR
ncbi:enoyl-CoA hydratase/isomerase family protein [Verrucosispora sioxanthis]|uniref:Enoyl-CoA hydratase/isomerase family protein n=1 Tax=Verrucosispora sioxanthis TaxID=2499994 RepID=A0A6M1KVF8_9ACTN|nr:enoyl-CoA hydratase/isomerase family protein [Verrucosispora sioxanthis]NEE63656.1 enoyl-CoA hydratase/isomerase family protein [Verrucosispora sioxanthis]NGM12766.1 enoyl-CoA hydratase/isomerase family protein [Verrucosispora sioxanthis]